MDKELREQQRKEHIEKMRALNEKHGIAWTGDIMPDGWTKETLKAEVMKDPEKRDLSFIPLKFWDGLAMSMLVFQNFPGLSKSQAVCMQKQACLDYLFRDDKTHCIVCGEEFTSLTPPALLKKGICSYSCWSELYGEEPD